MFVVAGVTGHVGGVVATELLARGETVRVLVRSAAKGEVWSRQGAEVTVAALDDPTSLTDALQGAAGFFALLPPNFAASDFYASQRRTGDAIAQAVKQSGVPHVVMLSSIGADLAEGTGPVKGLHHLERALRATGVRLTAIRAGSFQENIASAIGSAKSAGIYPNATPSADFELPMIATRDIGELAAFELRMPSSESEIVDLVGPAYSANQLARKLGAKLGKALRVVDLSVEGQVAAMVQAGLSAEHAAVFGELVAAANRGELQPKGDRLKHGPTPIDAVIETLV